MSTYQRPPRSDELYHWGKGQESRFHKYIAKIGNRYFYTPEEVAAYKQAKASGERLRNTAAQQRQQAKQVHKDIANESSRGIEKVIKKNWSFRKQDREAGKKELEESEKRLNSLLLKEPGLKRAAEANERSAAYQDERAAKIPANKSLITQIAFKRAVEKEDRDKEKERKRKIRKQKMDSGRKKVMQFFREKGWIL